MGKRRGASYYAVKVGRERGVYMTCEERTSGFSGAVFKGFSSLSEAEAFLGPAPRATLEPSPATAASLGDNRSFFDRSPTTPGPNAAESARGGGGGGGYGQTVSGGGDGEAWVKVEKDDDDFKWTWRDGAGEGNGAGMGKQSAAAAGGSAGVSWRYDYGGGDDAGDGGGPNERRGRKVEDEYPYELSTSQTHAVAAAVSNRSLFVTGPAGVGKSFCMDRVVAALKLQGKQVALTASTGIAGVLIGGSTVHSWAGIGLGDGTVEDVVSKVLGSKDARKRWRQHDALVLDEISMIDGMLLDKLDAVGRAVRGTAGNPHPEPFGGVQMIFVGDFYQLPPVAKESPRGRGVYAFESKAWRAVNPEVIELTEVFRQADPNHVSLLHRVRVGVADDEVAAAMDRCRRPLRSDDGVLPTTLYPRRVDVRAENLHHFAKLPDRERTYTAVDTSMGSGGEAWFGTLDRDLQAQKHLRLKIGAQVMLLANMDVKGGLCNGSRGVVVGFTEVGHYDSAITSDERRHMEELRAMLMGDRRGDGGGEGKSRPRTMSDKDLFFAAMDSDSRRFFKGMEDAGLGLPIVRFACGRTMTMTPFTWTKTKANGVIELSRKQIPLALAWALTIHKCQGMSLDRVRMDLSHVFSEGQAYVALSRARTLDGMEIMGYELSAIRASDRVRAFYQASGSAFGTQGEGGRGGSREGDGGSGSSDNDKKRRRANDGGGGDDDDDEAGWAAGVAAGAGDGFLQAGDAEVAADALVQAARGAAAAAARAGAADPAASSRDELILMATAAIDAGLKAWRNNTRR